MPSKPSGAFFKIPLLDIQGLVGSSGRAEVWSKEISKASRVCYRRRGSHPTQRIPQDRETREVLGAQRR